MLGAYMDTIPNGLSSARIIKKIRDKQQKHYHIIELEHCYIRYRMEGKGSHTLVFAADAPVNLEDYDTLIAHLKDQYRVVVMELPGFGFSLPKLSMSFKFDASVDVLEEFLSHLNCPPYVLGLPCAAGYFAIRLADKIPSDISHLVMLQTPDWQQEQCWKQRLDPKNLISKPFVGQAIVRARKNQIAHQWIEYSCQCEELTQQIQNNCSTNFGNGASYSLASALQISLPSEQPLLNKVSQPSIAIYGKSDKSHRTTDFNSITRYFHDIRVLGLDGVGHLPELEAPASVSQSIHSLLSSTEFSRTE